MVHKTIFETPSAKSILITVDVEDWFQVENLKGHVAFSDWPSHELRVERNTNNLLDLFDSAAGDAPAGRPTVQATFFVLGWIAEKLPHLVQQIAARGHEVASHGFEHHLCSSQSRDALASDLNRSRQLLEDITGREVVGYRAPSFSINDDVLTTIKAAGYRYDSSYNSFAMHDRYGRCSACRINGRAAAVALDHAFHEIPVSNLSLAGRTLPWGGGGYFRLIPSMLFRMGIRKILQTKEAYVFYLHPWEIDPGQPRITTLPWSYRFRHYVNLNKTYDRLKALLRHFADCNFVTCHRYLEMLPG